MKSNQSLSNIWLPTVLSACEEKGGRENEKRNVPIVTYGTMACQCNQLNVYTNPITNVSMSH